MSDYFKLKNAYVKEDFLQNQGILSATPEWLLHLAIETI